MKRIILLFLAVSLVASSGFAFLYEIDVLDRKAIKQLSNDELIDVYIDVVVEIKASESFHTTSGYKPSGYKKYKAILRYKILLNNELKERKLNPPSLDLPDVDYPEEKEDTTVKVK